MTPEEKAELAELLRLRTLTPFERRRERFVAAEKRLGVFDADGTWTGRRLAEIIERCRKGKAQSLDEFLVASFGALPEEVAARREACDRR